MCIPGHNPPGWSHLGFLPRAPKNRSKMGPKNGAENWLILEPKTAPKRSQNRFRNGSIFGSLFFSVSGLSWALLDSLLGPLGAVLEVLKATKWLPFARFEPFTFSLLGALDDPLGPILAPLGPILNPNWPPKWRQKWSKSGPKTGPKIYPKINRNKYQFWAHFGGPKPRPRGTLLRCF